MIWAAYRLSLLVPATPPYRQRQGAPTLTQTYRSILAAKKNNPQTIKYKPQTNLFITFTPVMKEKVLKYLKNYYIMGAAFFVVWMLFFDKNDFITQFRLKSQLYDMRSQRDFYKEQTNIVEQERKELLEDDALLEKFAREKYWMKKESEDIYIVEEVKK